MQGFSPRVRAVLGPTNTGKTHLAMARLLAHASGIIGFPLRLLARENYDRMVAEKGVRFVGLITGEEKIIPPEARWFSCTVEAMPLDRAVEFVAIDEIQLCADPDRGHVFTDRLLRARGLVETMVMGAETIRPLIQRLVPDIQIETRPRLSKLVYSGPAKLTRLPPRSAVVAFSAAEVYAIAEMIRRRRGGCAVVMGRLSPRTRNAQVALYQEKEVDFLVATDAIGMGLNMDVDHVGFAGISKYDGHRLRRLTAPETAQIAGRAGRGMRDGTFGSTADCPALPEELVRAVEAHDFEPLDQLCWRNSDLDFASIDSLLATLQTPPPRRGLVRGNDSSDLQTLAALSRDDAVRAKARGPRRVRLLWEACQIPDFRKITDDSHVQLCARIFGHVADGGHLPVDWIAAQMDRLDRVEGDIDTLMQRLSGVRVWSYVAARADWVKDAAHWQARAREIEDLISDSLHEKLMHRFVDRRAALLMRRLEESEGQDLLSAVTARGEVVVEGHSVGHVAAFTFIPDPAAVGGERRMVLRAARRALGEEIPRRVARLEAAGDEAFTRTPNHRLLWQEQEIARLRPGHSVLRPMVEVVASEFLDGPMRERIRRRLQSFVDAEIARVFAPLFVAVGAPVPPAARGLLHRLREGMGLAAAQGEDEQHGALRLVGGRFAWFLPALLRPAAMALRASLLALAKGVETPALPLPSLTSIAAEQPWPEGFATALGWVSAGPVLLRLDVAERLAAELQRAAGRRGNQAPLPPGLASRLSLRAEMLPAVLRGLGFRLQPAAGLSPETYGPPMSPVVTWRPRPRITPGTDRAQSGAGPFASLAVLRQSGRR
ncbi:MULTISPECIES: helicase-related protein [unclassified Acidisoma]|jgi:ATP-dependent RNA helicase SUPV3L1/SUV3|uniref:helicase-related protein n=1 Tax=unclassified Acidisoma TaxID=2634065 RepID=UPI00131E7B78|nr:MULTISPECIES: helicase-related protein [unclassified Acidisoma]